MVQHCSEHTLQFKTKTDHGHAGKPLFSNITNTKTSHKSLLCNITNTVKHHAKKSLPCNITNAVKQHTKKSLLCNVTNSVKQQKRKQITSLQQYQQWNQPVKNHGSKCSMIPFTPKRWGGEMRFEPECCGLNHEWVNVLYFQKQPQRLELVVRHWFPVPLFTTRRVQRQPAVFARVEARTLEFQQVGANVRVLSLSIAYAQHFPCVVSGSVAVTWLTVWTLKDMQTTKQTEKQTEPWKTCKRLSTLKNKQKITNDEVD